jgi:small subunit ribosomal protein S9
VTEPEPAASSETASPPSTESAPTEGTSAPTVAPPPEPAAPSVSAAPQAAAPLAESGKTYYWGTGRRKRAIARVRVRSGSGKFEINGRDVDNYFRLEADRNAIRQPLAETGTAGRMDVFVNVYGGGPTGQSGAIMLGLARALRQVDPSYEQPLRKGNFLTRDARKVERKKYGQRGARRRFQFSKR